MGQLLIKLFVRKWAKNIAKCVTKRRRSGPENVHKGSEVSTNVHSASAFSQCKRYLGLRHERGLFFKFSVSKWKSTVIIHIQELDNITSLFSVLLHVFCGCNMSLQYGKVLVIHILYVKKEFHCKIPTVTLTFQM